MRQLKFAIYVDNLPCLPIHDLQNNLIQLHSGEDTKIQEFDAFGKGKHILPWGYSSKRYDSETGFIYFGRRFYDPSLGRFITADPEGYVDTINLYSFCQNNPLIYHDPHGLLISMMPQSISLGMEDIENKRQSFIGAAHGIMQWGIDTALNLGWSYRINLEYGDFSQIYA